MKIKISDIKDFVKSLNKVTKIILAFGTPIILSLFVGGMFLQFAMLINGHSSVVSELSENLIRCAVDSFAAVYIPSFFIEAFSGKYR